ncbi:hypothetical protein [Streptomyces sp. NRRL WC-3744]|uniref:hypothetical protein n=1 Tax=Streptomyces sp. NRRL WC-3744 TaxID=1463935 RepID=UPI0004CB5746|nr:hypothetical protein [Streptomyces sp. NRRL WC-3744]
MGYRGEIERVFTRLPSMLVHTSGTPERRRAGDEKPAGVSLGRGVRVRVAHAAGQVGAEDLDAFLGDFRRDIEDLNLADFDVYGAESHEWEFN